MRKVTLVLLGILLLFVMTGCGKNKVSITAEDVTTNIIVIKEDNTVQSSIVEDFDKEYYSKEELEAFINQEVIDYNQKNGGNQIKMHSIHVADQKASVVFNYNDIDDYAVFNGANAKLLTTSQVLEEDLSLSTLEFVEAKSGDIVSSETAFSKESATVLVIQEPLEIKIEGTILYYSNAKKVEKDVLQADGKDITVVVFTN